MTEVWKIFNGQAAMVAAREDNGISPLETRRVGEMQERDYVGLALLYQVNVVERLNRADVVRLVLQVNWMLSRNKHSQFTILWNFFFVYKETSYKVNVVVHKVIMTISRPIPFTYSRTTRTLNEKVDVSTDLPIASHEDVFLGIGNWDDVANHNKNTFAAWNR